MPSFRPNPPLPFESIQRVTSTHVQIRDPSSGAYFGEYPREIVMDAGQHVVVFAWGFEQLPFDIKPLVFASDEKNISPTCPGSGDYLVSVPVAWCQFLSADQAEDLAALIQVDQKLLASA